MQLITKAKKEIDARLSDDLRKDYEQSIPEYFQALEISSKALEAQIRLNEMIELITALNQGDQYSVRTVRTMLEELKWNWEGENNDQRR